MELPDGFEEVEAKVYKRGDQLLVVTGEVAVVLELRTHEATELPEVEEDPGPPPPGFEWTGENRPPFKGEYFWSDIKGRVVQAINDETGVNQFGEPTGGRKILRPVPPPPLSRPRLRLVRDEE